MCLPGGPEVMLSVVNMKEVCQRVAVEDVEVAFSRDAGRCFSCPCAKQVGERGTVLPSPLSLLKRLFYAVHVAALVTGISKSVFICHRHCRLI